MGETHDRILSVKQRLIEDLARDRDHPAADDEDVLLALADTRSSLGQWIRGDEVDTQDPGSVASFVFVGDRALLFLGDVPSYPGLVVLVVDQEDDGVLVRFISGAPRT